MDPRTKFEQGCLLHQQLFSVQFSGEWEDLKLQYKTEWDCFRFYMFLVLSFLFLGQLAAYMAEELYAFLAVNLPDSIMSMSSN